MIIRPLLASDRPALAAGFENLSPRSRRLRFFLPPATLSDEQLDYLANIDYVNHFAWAAFALDEVDQPGIGVARYIRLADRLDTAEAAVTVLDAYQGRGLGSLLLVKLAMAAVDRGVRRFVAYILVENTALIEQLTELGARCHREEPGVTRVEFDIPGYEADIAPFARLAVGSLARGLNGTPPS